MTRPILTVSLIFAIYLPLAVFAQTASLKPASIFEGDVAVLTVEYQSRIPSLLPLDMAPLQQDFEILGIKSSLRGKKTEEGVIKVMHWEIDLFPKRKGLVPVPSLNIKGSLTPRLVLKVNDWNEQNNGGERIYIEANSEPDRPYVGQQVIVTLKLIHNRSLGGGILYDLKLDQAEIYPLGNDRRYRQRIDGEAYNVLERKLALFAKTPGQLALPAVKFRGQIDSFDARQILRVSPRILLTLLPENKDYSGRHWLPASEVDISQEWLHLDKTLSSGDTISRKITVSAKGLAASALPETLLEYDSSSFQVYADKARYDNRTDDEGITGKLEQTHAIVLTGSGEVHIPAIRIHWWDVDEDIEKTVLLPGRNLLVQAPATTENLFDEQTRTEPVFTFWRIAAFAGLLLIVFFCYLATRWYLTENGARTKFSRRRFKQACMSGDLPTAYCQLRHYAAGKIGDRANPGLYDLAAASASQQFSEQLKLLDRALFGSGDLSWNSRQLWRAFSTHRIITEHSTDKDSKKLPALYSG